MDHFAQHTVKCRECLSCNNSDSFARIVNNKDIKKEESLLCYFYFQLLFSVSLSLSYMNIIAIFYNDDEGETEDNKTKELRQWMYCNWDNIIYRLNGKRKQDEE